MVYKAAYKKRMLAESRNVLSTRAAQMKKQKNILLDKTYYFAIPMSWSIYKEERFYDNRVHQNQYINYNRLDYVLKRYSDWIVYRTNWFYRSNDQRIGPEYSLIGNNHVMWSTASKDKHMERQLIVGVSNFVGRFNFKKTQANGVFIMGTLDGSFTATNCKNMNECKKMYVDSLALGINNVPYALFQNQKRIWSRGCTGGKPEWNGIYSK